MKNHFVWNILLHTGTEKENQLNVLNNLIEILWWWCWRIVVSLVFLLECAPKYLSKAELFGNL